MPPSPCGFSPGSVSLLFCLLQGQPTLAYRATLIWDVLVSNLNKSPLPLKVISSNLRLRACGPTTELPSAPQPSSQLHLAEVLGSAWDGSGGESQGLRAPHCTLCMCPVGHVSSSGMQTACPSFPGPPRGLQAAEPRGRPPGVLYFPSQGSGKDPQFLSSENLGNREGSTPPGMPPSTRFSPSPAAKHPLGLQRQFLGRGWPRPPGQTGLVSVTPVTACGIPPS